MQNLLVLFSGQLLTTVSDWLHQNTATTLAVSASTLDCLS